MKFLALMLMSSFILANSALAANTLYIHHKVTDYPKWRQAFDSHKAKQMEAGLTNPRVFKTDGNTQDVSILFDATDVNKAKAFTESEDLKMTMQKAGVQGKPEMHILVTE
jgi:hypothetical protein